MVLTGKHNFEDAIYDIEKIKDVPTFGRDIEIGEGSWIASGSIILGGVKIGKNCVVMAGSVVTKNIDDYTIVAGIPAKVVRKLK